MVYDCFQFYNEIDMLLIRMNILKDIVDKFVISEATETFSGLKKPLNFQENRALFKDFEDKIIYSVVDDTPEGYTHDRDTFQKNAVGRGLKDAKDDDIVIFSDLDEIPNPDKVREIIELIKQNKDNAADKVFHLAQRMFYCYLNMEEVTGNLLAYCGEFDGYEGSDRKWLGTKICSYKIAKTMPIGELRWPKCKEFGVRVENGGWHFGYMGGHNVADIKERVSDKVKSAAHQELNKERLLNEVVDKINDGRDMFDRNAKFVRVEIDETFPEYLRTHQSKYAHLIKAKDKPFESVSRKVRIASRNAVHRMKQIIWNVLHGNKK